MKAWALMCLGAAGLAVSGLAILPSGMDAARLLLGPRDEAAVAHYVITRTSAADYQALAERALAARDEDLAYSVAALAGQNGVVLPPALLARIRSAGDEAAAHMGEDVWTGFALGEAKNEAALAGALAADLTGLGDLRDLYQQAARYLNGEEVDGMTVGLATAGLGLTAATVASFGMTLPERAGVSTLKAVKRAGRLSPALVREAGDATAAAMDGAALEAVSTSLARFDLAGAQQAAGRVVKPEALSTLKKLGTDAATIGKNAGYRATVETLGTAGSAEEVSTIAKLSSRFGKATRAVVALGGAGLTFISLTASAAFWSLSLIFWCCTAVFWIGRLGHRIGRWIWPKPERPLQPA